MNKLYTQTECKAIWEAVKNNQPTLEQIQDIDNKTPWSETEPSWWLEMMDVRKQILFDKMKRLI